MDGTRDRPPGKTAENWSRRDGIRAGSVTGPWRSGPRAGPPMRLALKPDPPQPQPPLHAPATPPRGRRSRDGSAGGWLGLGFAAAVLLAAGTYVLRPAPAPVGDPGELAAAEPSAPAAAAAPPAVAAVSEVRVRVGPTVDAERRADLVAALEAAGYPEVRVEALPFKVESSRVGFFRAADRPAAEALSASMASKMEAGVGVRDYSQLNPDPIPGTLDLWVEG